MVNGVNVTTDTRANCKQIKGWLTARGVSDDAADMKNFRIADEKNITLNDIDTNLAFFKKYEDALKSDNVKNMVNMMMMMLSAEIGKDIDAMKDLNITKPTRMLAADDSLEITEVDSTDAATSLAAGTDNNLDETDLDDVTEIPQDTLST